MVVSIAIPDSWLALVRFFLRYGIRNVFGHDDFDALDQVARTARGLYPVTVFDERVTLFYSFW